MTTNGENHRSTFVTVVAWVFIILTGFGAFISLMQNVMFSQMFAMPEMQQAMSQHNEMPNMPFFARFMFQHFQLYLFLILLFITSFFVSSIGLLKRKNWARIIFICMMLLGIIFVLMGFGLQFVFDPVSQGIPQEQIPPEMIRMMNMMKISMFIFTASLTVLFGWVIKKLTSKKIRQEFNNA